MPVNESVSAFVDFVVAEAEAGRIDEGDGTPLTAQESMWAAQAYLDEGMRQMAIVEAAKAFSASTDATQREKVVEFLLRQELLKAESIEELRRLLAA